MNFDAMDAEWADPAFLSQVVDLSNQSEHLTNKRKAHAMTEGNAPPAAVGTESTNLEVQSEVERNVVPRRSSGGSGDIRAFFSRSPGARPAAAPTPWKEDLATGAAAHKQTANKTARAAGNGEATTHGKGTTKDGKGSNDGTAAQSDAAAKKAEKEAEKERIKAEKALAAAKVKADKQEQKDRVKAQKAAALAQSKAQKEAKVAPSKVEKAAEVARARAEKEAKTNAKATNQAEVARPQAEKDSEVARAKAEKELGVALAKAAKEADVARAQAEKDSEVARVKAEKELGVALAKATKEADVARAKIEHEAKARVKAEREAEAARTKAQNEARARSQAEKEAEEARAQYKKLVDKTAQAEQASRKGPRADGPIAIDAAMLPRVRSSMSMAALKRECAARAMKGCAALGKERLVAALREGSICLAETQVYKSYRALLDLMSSEDPEKIRAKDTKRAQQAERERRQVEMEAERTRQVQEENQQREQRRREIAAQAGAHTETHPRLHACPLAPTQHLLYQGAPRQFSARCSGARSNPFHKEYSGPTLSPDLLVTIKDPHSNPELCDGSIAFSCEKCDFDLCEGCVAWKRLTEAEQVKRLGLKIAEHEKEQEQKRKREREEAREREKAEKKREKEREVREKERRRAQDEAFKAFDKTIGGPFAEEIQNPPPSHRDQAVTKGFTVWSSCGYGNDGWHSYNPPPAKEFDSTYPTKAAAEKRAKYLFFRGNSFGLGVEDLEESQGHEHEWSLEACACPGPNFKLRWQPPDSEIWTVGVLPAAAFSAIKAESESEHSYGIVL